MERSLQHRFRTVDDKARVHFDRDLYAVIFGELAVLDPEGSDFLFPLPVEQVQILRRPRAGNPIRIFRVCRYRRGSRKNRSRPARRVLPPSSTVRLLVSA